MNIYYHKLNIFYVKLYDIAPFILFSTFSTFSFLSSFLEIYFLIFNNSLFFSNLFIFSCNVAIYLSNSYFFYTSPFKFFSLYRNVYCLILFSKVWICQFICSNESNSERWSVQEDILLNYCEKNGPFLARSISNIFSSNVFLNINITDRLAAKINANKTL